VKLAGRAIVDVACGKSIGGEALIDAVCSGRGKIGYTRVRLSPTVPIVAVGAPVRVYYDEVGRRLDTEVIFPPFCEVANAVGAATGAIARSVTVTVDGDGAGHFHVHTPRGTTVFDSAALALVEAETAARESARAAVLEMGGEEPEVRVSIERHFLPGATGDEGLLGAEVVADAVSRPVTYETILASEHFR
jgi:hypothetical protein